MAREAIKDGTELVIGVGGDGTMNEIANGFYEDRRIINPEATLGIVPSGTGCDLIKSLNIPAGLKGALQVITEAPSVRMDVGRVRYRSNAGREDDRFFLNVADFGLGGEVVREVDRAPAPAEGLVLRPLPGHDDGPIQEQARPHPRRRGEPARRGISHRRRGQRPDLRQGHEGRPRRPSRRRAVRRRARPGIRFLEFCRHGWKLMNGSHVTHPKVSVVRGRRIEAWADDGEDVLLELDGEQLGRLPATFEIVPRNLLVKGYL